MLGRDWIYSLDSRIAWCLNQGMSTNHAEIITELKATQDRIRRIRSLVCEPKVNTNPRYLALSNVVTHLGRAIADLENELA